MANAATYQCPNCHGVMSFDAATGRVVCEYCGSAFDAGERAGAMPAVVKRFGTGILLVCAIVALIAFAPAGKAHAAGDQLSVGTPEGGALSTQATAYRVWVGGTQVTSANASDVLRDGGSVRYDAKTNTLTLRTAKVKDARYRYVQSNGGQYRSGISSEQGKKLTISLKGKSTITTTGSANAGNYAIYAGIRSKSVADVAIKGTGSLTARAGKAGLYSFGILCRNLEVKGKAKAAFLGGSMVSTDRTPTDEPGSIGVYCEGKVALSGSAALTASGGTRAFYSAPKFASGCTPQVKAGSSSKNIKMNKRKPARSIYTKYRYVKITKAASKAGSGASSSKKPVKMKLTKIDVLSGQFLVHWNALTENCTGYQMQVAESSKFPANATRKYALVPKEYEGAYAWNLDPGTRYYVRVRAYHTVGGKKVWGAYSNVKSAIATSSPLRAG